MSTYIYTTLDYQGPYRTFLYDINNEGEIAGQYTTYGVSFLCSDGAFATLNNELVSLGAQASVYVTGINDSGQVIGYSLNYGDFGPSPPNGFLFSNGSLTSILDPNAYFGNTAPASINNLGQIVGSYQYAPYVSHGFIFAGGSYTDIQYPLDTTGLNIDGIGISTGLSGINDLGQIVGNYSYLDDNIHQYVSGAFLDINGSFTTIAYPAAATTVATGINNLGVIVGYYQPTAYASYHGFIYDHGVYTSLDYPTDAPYLIPEGINDAGDIVGYYADNLSGAYRGFLATPLPANLTVIFDQPLGGSTGGGLVTPFLSDPFATSSDFIATAPDLVGDGYVHFRITMPLGQNYIGALYDETTATWVADTAWNTGTGALQDVTEPIHAGNEGGQLIVGHTYHWVFTTVDTANVAAQWPTDSLGEMQVTIYGSAVAANPSLVSLDISNLVNADLTLYSNASSYPQNGGLVTVAGIPFQLATGPNNDTFVVQGSWDGTVGDIAIPGPSQTFSILPNLFGVTAVDTLINSAFGVAGTNIGSLVFYAKSGATFTYNLIEGVNVRDHNQDGFDNSATNLAGSIEFGPFVRFDMQKIILPATFYSDTLVKIDFVSFGQGLNGVPFLAAIDAEVAAQSLIASNVTASANEDTNLQPVTIPASFTDTNPNDTFTFKVDTSGTIGAVTNNGDGTFTYDSNGKFEYLALGETATDTFAYTVVDGHGASSTAIATVTIHGEDDPPTIVSADLTGVINELPNVTGSLLLDTASGKIAFSDPDLSDKPAPHLTKQTVIYRNATGQDVTGELSAAQISTLKNAFLPVPDPGNTNNGKIDWGYTINDSALDFLGVGETIAVTSTVEIDDGHGDKVDQDVVVTITGADDLPVLSPSFANATSSSPATGNVLANAADPDIHDVLHVTSVSFAGKTVSVGLGDPASIQGALGTLTLGADGAFVYTDTAGSTKSGQDLFSYTVSDGHSVTSSSGLSVSVTATNAAGNTSSGLQSAANIFGQFGADGEVVVLSQLSEAAYHLLPFEKVGNGINIDFPIDDAAYSFLPAGLKLLTSADMPSISPLNVPDQHFPTKGLAGGIYLDGNAAALVARSSDSLFISFRGTNDAANFLSDLIGGVSHLGGTPDTNDYTIAGMNDYYALLKPLISAMDDYLSAHSEIRHVYATGHSLGASMAQIFMNDDIAEHHAAVSFQAVTFANPGYGFSSDTFDPRITNVMVNGDPIEQSPYTIKGDIYQIVDYDFASGGGNFHDLSLYNTAAQYLSNQHVAIPQPTFIANGQADLINVYTNVTYVGNSVLPWQITMPTGDVPGNSGFQLYPRFDIYMNEIIGVNGGGTLTGGPGPDTFVFNPGFGKVAVTDFSTTKDVLQFDHSLFGSAKALLANTRDDGHGDTVITYDAGDTVILMGVTKSQLSVSDFHLV